MWKSLKHIEAKSAKKTHCKWESHQTKWRFIGKIIKLNGAFSKPCLISRPCGFLQQSFSDAAPCRIMSAVVIQLPMTDPWCWYINANMTGVY